MEVIGAQLDSRAICPSGSYYSRGQCWRRSNWYYWGRWVVAGVIIFVVVFICLIMACMNSRRRRKRGLRPMYGTGWMAPNSKFGGPHPPNQQWAAGYGNTAPPPPLMDSSPTYGVYSPPPGLLPVRNKREFRDGVAA
ncbi:unnamed protein product [Parascedosporium putredinis]|uniref:Uncharacterized protein n=1 Tax=Parascedosporium putredinis TaxID=1442378 RepID=A0A9P1MCL4_9PEZI|nr:unnamed protein product [Parascedosporium putredinis]CAI7998052.1 unnamed protein product [Parascedosporium putredinis]